MGTELAGQELLVAGRLVPDASDRVRRYCGLPWYGGGLETWAFRYYDVVTANPDGIGPIDVLAASALHPGLSRSDLAFFAERSAEIATWLRDVPASAQLPDVDPAVLRRVVDIREWPGAPSLTLLSKVLHRCRPGLIPLVDKHILDWYRPVTGERSAPAAWPALLKALGEDVVINAQPLAEIRAVVAGDTGVEVSDLRLIDIAIWMRADR